MNYMLGNYFHNLYPRGYDSNISIINIERIYGDKLKDCNGKLITEYDYLVVAHEHEVSDFHIFEDLYKWITKFSLPTDKIILVMGDDALETEYDRYCKINSIDNKINIVSAYFMEVAIKENFSPKYKDKVLDTITKTLNDKKPYRFLNMNGRLKEHRQLFLKSIKKHKLDKYINHSELEYGKPLDVYNFKNMNYKNVEELYEKEVGSILEDTRVTMHNMDKDQHLNMNIKHAFADMKWLTPHKENLLPLYQQHSIDIVSESEANVDNHLFLTEKTLRPLYFGLPFILLGNQGSLQRLKDMGYKTYSNIIDESYDTKPKWQNRLNHVLMEIKRFNEMSDDEFHTEVMKTNEIRLHNLNHFFDNRVESDRVLKKLKKVMSI